MTEKQWLTTTRPYRLTAHVEATSSSRKLRLLGVACCSQIRHLFESPLLGQAVDAAEQYADGSIDGASLDCACRLASGVYPRGNEGTAAVYCSSRDQFHIHLVLAGARAAARNRGESKVQCDLIRDIIGNPFRPTSFSPTWRTDTAVSLARMMYEPRDFGAMPILADALQDAGCDNDDILAHCRDANQVHVRGCWVLDLVLGKA